MLFVIFGTVYLIGLFALGAYYDAPYTDDMTPRQALRVFLWPWMLCLIFIAFVWECVVTFIKFIYNCGRMIWQGQ